MLLLCNIIPTFVTVNKMWKDLSSLQPQKKMLKQTVLSVQSAFSYSY